MIISLPFEFVCFNQVKNEAVSMDVPSEWHFDVQDPTQWVKVGKQDEKTTS